MKVRASVKKLCRNCKVVRRRGVVRIICSATHSHILNASIACCRYADPQAVSLDQIGSLGDLLQPPS